VRLREDCWKANKRSLGARLREVCSKVRGVRPREVSSKVRKKAEK